MKSILSPFRASKPTKDWVSAQINRDATKLDMDAFSSGQIDSKLWMCEHLELLTVIDQPARIWCYGGWYSMLSFLLFSRGKMPIEAYVSFDQDPNATAMARLVNEPWKRKGLFNAETADCSTQDYKQLHGLAGSSPTLVVNTSVEHFASASWWENLPANQLVAIQGCNMEIADHVSRIKSLSTMRSQFSMREIFYEGELNFAYKNWGFTRFMLIGRK